MATFVANNSPKPSYIIALGDNFYDDGVSSATDALWTSLWKNVYITNYSDLNVPWYPVLGNHDYGSGQQGVQAQINRYQNHTDDDIWTMPATNYSQSFDIPGGGRVTTVFIDTTTLAPSVNECCNEDGGVSQETQERLIKNQLANIEKMLAASRNSSDWLLVAGHYPIYSAGDHGDNDELSSYLQPLLVKYKVDAYFSGHDHISEHLKITASQHDIHYFVAGAGSMTDAMGEEKSNADLVWNATSYNTFVYCLATVESLSVVYVDTDSDVRYFYTILRDNTSEAGKGPERKSFFGFSVPIWVPLLLCSAAFGVFLAVLAAGCICWSSMEAISMRGIEEEDVVGNWNGLLYKSPPSSVFGEGPQWRACSDQMAREMERDREMQRELERDKRDRDKERDRERERALSSQRDNDRGAYYARYWQTEGNPAAFTPGNSPNASSPIGWGVSISGHLPLPYRSKVRPAPAPAPPPLPQRRPPNKARGRGTASLDGSGFTPALTSNNRPYARASEHLYPYSSRHRGREGVSYRDLDNPALELGQEGREDDPPQPLPRDFIYI